MTLNPVQIHSVLIVTALVGLLCFMRVAHTSMWFDPDWETMIKTADLIARVIVVKGGRSRATVRVLSVLKGEKPRTDIEVSGLVERGHWPADEEKFSQGERYILFLQKDQHHYWLWSQTAGALPEKPVGHVRHDLFETTDSESKPAQSFQRLQAFIPNAVSYLNEGQPNLAYLDTVYQNLQTARDKNSVNPEVEAYQLMTLHLAGEGRYKPLWEIIAKTGRKRPRLALAKLLSRVRTSEANQLLILLAADTDSLVQGEAVRQLRSRKLEPDVLGTILVKQLASAGTDGRGPIYLIDPVRNTTLSGKIEIIRALAEIQYQPAVPALEKLLQVDYIEQPGVFVEAATAIYRLGSEAFVPYFNSVLMGDLWGLGPLPVMKLCGEWRVTGCRGAIETYLLKSQQNGSETFAATQALKQMGDSGSAYIIHDLLKKTLQKEHLLSNDPDTENFPYYMDALIQFKFKPARKTFEQVITYWYGIDMIMVSNPWIVELKTFLERTCVDKVRAIVGSAPEDIACLVHINNLNALARNCLTEPEISIRSYIAYIHDKKKHKLLSQKIAYRLNTPESFIHIMPDDANHRVDTRLSRSDRYDLLNKFALYANQFSHPKDASLMRILADRTLSSDYKKLYTNGKFFATTGPELNDALQTLLDKAGWKPTYIRVDR